MIAQKNSENWTTGNGQWGPGAKPKRFEVRLPSLDEIEAARVKSSAPEGAVRHDHLPVEVLDEGGRGRPAKLRINRTSYDGDAHLGYLWNLKLTRPAMIQGREWPAGTLLECHSPGDCLALTRSSAPKKPRAEIVQP